MRSIRKIGFRNAAGERYGLNGEKGVYATGLSGLGFSLAPSFGDLGRGFFIPVSDESEPQSSVPFTMVFTQSPYHAYKRFADWLAAAGTLTIVYNPTGTQEYYRDVSVNFLQKGELTEVGWLEIPCSLFCNTPWYLPTPTGMTLEASGADESKRYDYEYTDDFRYGSDSSAALSGTIVGAGHIPGALELSYHGAVTNPKIRLVGEVTGKTYGICSIAAVLESTDTLTVSTRYENSYVRKISATGEVTDLLDALDLTLTPFFHIPVDEPCTVSVESDATLAGYANLMIFYYYRSV